MKKEPEKKDIAKAYGKYAKQFTPKPKYFLNCLRAFGTGGAVCALALRYQNFLTDNGIGIAPHKKSAGPAKDRHHWLL